MTIKSANISAIKARFTGFLMTVRKGGEVVVLDRKTPIAKIVPWSEQGSDLRVQEPTVTIKEFLKIKRCPLSASVDSLSVLKSDRAKR